MQYNDFYKLLQGYQVNIELYIVLIYLLDIDY